MDGLTQVSWCLGPVVVFVLAAALAIVTWALRRGLPESARWRGRPRSIFSGIWRLAPRVPERERA